MRAIFNSRQEKIEKSNAKVVLFFLSRDGECDDKTKALALGILGKFLQCTSPVVSVVSFNGCVCLPFEAAFLCCDDCSVHSTKQAFFTL